MLDICLGILAVLGIVLLVLAALAAASLLLVLFFPLTYRVRGFREPEAFGLTVNVRWLLGLVRAVCRYPDPGRLKVKVLCFSLYDQGLAFGEEEKAGSGRKRKKKKEKSEPGEEAYIRRSSIQSWFNTFMIMNIPIIGWIYLLILALKKNSDQRKDFARAYLVYKLVFFLVALGILIVLMYSGMEVIDRLLRYMNML